MATRLRLTVQINLINPESLQARVAGLLDVSRVASDTLERAARPADKGELGAQKHRVPVLLHERPQELLVVAAAVHIGGVDERASSVGYIEDRD